MATEELTLKNMTRSAVGTVEEPGKQVTQKAGLNREILDTAPGLFTSLFRYKVLETGGEWVDAPTRKLKPSQLCPSGWHVVKKAVVVAIALLRAMWALGEQGYGLSACGVALGLGIDIRWGTGRDGDSTSL